MKNTIVLFALVFVLASCKKDCSGDNWSDWGKNMDIKKIDKGICIRNKYIYPIQIVEISIVPKTGKVIFLQGQTKILSGISHTFKYSDFILPDNFSASEIIGVSGRYTRDLCDYKERRTVISGFSGEYFGVRF